MLPLLLLRVIDKCFTCFQHLELEFWFVLLKTSQSSRRASHLIDPLKAAATDQVQKSICFCCLTDGIGLCVPCFSPGNQVEWNNVECVQARMKAHEHRLMHTHSLRCWFNGTCLCVCTNGLSRSVQISALMKYWLEILKYQPNLIKNSMHCLINRIGNHNEDL